ncbi:MAG: DUF262 domain-containing protein [Okeania sp. SIO2G4]|uniref:DUF262 domain-containing protein n=1 Tax=unclassified Okeania TaxID=2634635 RepID=UPI0013BA1798|nr:MULTISPECIES: DUF262 domain-containing HNH endonuclease family protein [unclassified Okeania]NEP75642.1 DUF262 domain-containing protein [Okeania sp. SIO2G5]NEP97110.1 DUF262 domain-containing protein [Okeania sp. SIO2F5]NEQ94801.1 DUF262 domain-containing protein [Okeania sp. SIO2G4]
MATIESQDMTLEKLFDEFYVIPDYQREYVWEEKEVNEFIQDIYEEFSEQNQNSYSEYFIGSIIVCSRGDNLYEVIDGQQRMTTAYLVLCAIRDYLLTINSNERIEALKNKITSLYTDDWGNDQFKHRVELQYEESRGILESIAMQTNLDQISPTRSVKHIQNAYAEIRKFLSLKFELDEVAISHIKKFYAYFLKNVKLIRVKTASVAHALKIYSTLNHRGLPLDDMDLLKNLIFAKAKQTDYEKIKVKWKKMIDLLYHSQERPMRFLRYFILARYAEDGNYIAEKEVYDWFLKNESRCGYNTEPILFVNDLLASAEAYVAFLSGNNLDGTVNRYLANIRCLSVNVRQHLILLLAAYQLPQYCFIELCRQIENLLFVAMLTSDRNQKAFDGMILKWASELRQITSRSEFNQFIASQFFSSKQVVADKFEKAFHKLNKSSFQPYQIKYILAKLTQYIDETAWGSGGGIDDLSNYLLKLDVEQILPEYPTQKVILSFDKPREIESYSKLLGNLTLLESSIKSAITNMSFTGKKLGYTKSRFLLTRTIAEKISVGNNTTIDLAVKDLKTFIKWDSHAIETRQEILTQLAKKVWDIPE